ncbi:unnamed protein product [Mytilus coruscus]|uniref:Uncharacterized protein n=1 Tax=Mytilus coruscus TaxID=42192 RepID=A0A6J8B9P7_MYTCO|nr:unnamed protein product [Mytilus coruscus]
MASIVDQQDKLHQEVQQFAKINTSKHNHLYTKDKLHELIFKVKNANEALKKSDQDRHLLKKNDVIEVADIEKLIKKEDMKNKSYHRVNDQSPYHALFGSDPKIGLSLSSLPKELLPNLKTEEDLEKVFNEVSEENNEIEIDGTDENTNDESVESKIEPYDSVTDSESDSTSTTIEAVSEEVDTPSFVQEKAHCLANKYKRMS